MGIHRIGRRTFLRSSSSLLALPVLASLDSRSEVFGKAQTLPKRLCLVYGPNGVWHPNWYPSDGSNWNSPILSPLQRHSHNFSLFKGFYSRNADYRVVNIRGGHGGAAAAYLTGTRPTPIFNGIFPRVATSIDQVMAAEIMAGSSPTMFPSLQFSGYSGPEEDSPELPAVYTNSIVWGSPNAPLIMETDPLRTFNRLFGPQDLRSKKSILDSVLTSGKRLRGQLGAHDQLKLDEYLDSVRAIEKRLKTPATILETASCPTNPPLPGSGVYPSTESYWRNLEAIFDVATLAFQCDLTRVIVIMLANEISNLPFSFLPDTLGNPIGPHHSTSHVDTAGFAMTQISRWEIERFAGFLDRLNSIQESDGTLLDHSLVVFGTGMRDSLTHRYDNLPFLLAGRGGGAIPSGNLGLFREFAQTPLSNAWLGIMNMMMQSPPTTLGTYWDEVAGAPTSNSDSTGAFDFQI